MKTSPKTLFTFVSLLLCVLWTSASFATTATLVRRVDVFPLFEAQTQAFENVGSMKAGQTFQSDSFREKARAVFEKSRELGVTKPKVSFVTISEADGRVTVQFIVEGDRALKLDSLAIVGGGLLDAPRARRFLQKHPVQPFKRGMDLTGQSLGRAVNLVNEFYRDLGYLEATVVIQAVKVLDSGNRADLVLVAHRGSRYEIDSIEIVQTQRLPVSEYQEIADSHLDKPAAQWRYQALERDFRILAQKKGYMGARVGLEHGVSPEDHTAAVRIHVDEGTTGTLGEVDLTHLPLSDPPEDPNWFQRFCRGRVAPPVSDDLARRMVRSESGGLLTWYDTQRLERRLQGLGVFDVIRVDTEPTTATHVRDLSVTVRDKRSGRLDFSGGWSTGLGIMGLLRISESNIGGHADRLSLTLQGGERRNGVRLSYLDREWAYGERFPWLSGTRWFGEETYSSLLHSGYFQIGDYDEYQEETIGLSTEWLREWEGRPGLWPFRFLGDDLPSAAALWTDGWRLRLERVGLNPDGDPDDYEEDLDDYYVAAVRYRMGYDSREGGDFADRGVYLGTSVETGMAEGFLLKWAGDWKYHVPLSRRWGYVTQAGLGLMPMPADEVGIGERFHAGGTDDLRGFEPRGMGPVDGREDDLHTGGATRALWRNELRYKVTTSLQALSFVDLAALDKNPLALGELGASAGLGLRYRFGRSGNGLLVYLSQPFFSQSPDKTTSVHFGMAL
ncbi:BamA/TamA family outer membrane protein, partial [bacterium]|nr:BamA/TamA family outer membrane protein [bacterium]